MSRRYRCRSGGTGFCRFQDETHRPEGTEAPPVVSINLQRLILIRRRLVTNVKTTTCSVLSVFTGFILSIELYEQKQPNRVIVQRFCGRDFNTVVIKAADHMSPPLLNGKHFFSVVLTLIGVCQQSFRFNNCPE